MKNRPNVIYVFTDQQCADAMGCDGNPYVRTPAADGLAASGVRFTNAYCTFPLCVPARMSMATGRMPHEMGIYANCRETEVPCPFPTFGTLFRDAGYETCWIGKWHLTIPVNDRRGHGFDQVVFGGGYGQLDHLKAGEAVSFLKRAHDRPFLLVVSLNNPHDCCELSRGDPLKMGPIPEPPSESELPPLPPNHEIPEAEPDCMAAFVRAEPRIFRARGWDDLQARRYLWGYYRLVEMADSELGRILDVVDETDLYDDTLIVFSSDHGDGAARHRLNQKWMLYEESAKVPFIVSGGVVGKAGRVDDRLVSAGLDLLPTLCDYAGLRPPEGLAGRSVRKLIDDGVAEPWRPFIGAETAFKTWAPVGQCDWPRARMVRSRRYKYVVCDSGCIREQFTDLVTDPGEKVNLAASPEHARELSMHRRHLKEWCEKTADVFPAGGVLSEP